MKLEVLIKPCPWCRVTPKMVLPNHEPSTWLWLIQCQNGSCTIKPESPYVVLRKTTKKDLNKIYSKVEELALKWNTNNPFPVIDKTVIDLTPLNLPSMYIP